MKKYFGVLILAGGFAAHLIRVGAPGHTVGQGRGQTHLQGHEGHRKEETGKGTEAADGVRLTYREAVRRRTSTGVSVEKNRHTILNLSAVNPRIT